MTAAYRFKGLGWMLTSVSVALVCYMVSLQVAAERRKVAEVAAQIRGAKRDIRTLETEFNARTNLAQLERWNGGTFRYAAPTPEQFASDQVGMAQAEFRPETTGNAKLHVAALVIPTMPDVRPAGPQAEPQVMVAVAAPAPRPATQTAVAAKPAKFSAPAVLQRVARVLIKPRVEQAVSTHVVSPRMALLDRKLLSDSTLGDLRAMARGEGGGTK